jgi:hypothetical protein
MSFVGFSQSISHVLAFFVIDKRLVLAVLRLNKPCVCLETRLQRFMCLEDEVCHDSRVHFVACFTSCIDFFFTVLLMLSRSLIIWPRKDTAVLKPCCAWSQLTKKSMAVLCLLLARMRVPSIGWGSVSIPP